jgi:hypothetical protein
VQYQCKTCLAMTDLPPGTDPHARTWCECCTVTDDSGAPHHHGRDVLSAEKCEEANHPGMPCFSPPGHADKPEGCTVCRPVMHFAVAGEPQLVSG